jgi:hypothetical protein
MTKRDIIKRLFIVASTLYFAFFIWTVWFKSPGNLGIIGMIEECYMKAVGKVISLTLLAFAIVEGVPRGISLVVYHIKNERIQKNFP